MSGISEESLRNFELPFSGQLKMMAGAFWATPVRNPVLVLTALLLAVIFSTTYAQYRLNEWNGPFYDALERRDMPEFLRQLGIFAVIACILTLLNVVQTWLNQITAMRMREGLARDLTDVWLAPGRAFKLGGAGAVGVNPDQRLHEDARILAENTTALGIGLVNSGILLASFVGVLWSISSDFVFEIGTAQISVPGYMVWATIFYALAGSLLSNVVGDALPRLNADRYAREADLRATLVRANENIKAITLAGGEADELSRVHGAIGEVLAMLRKVAMALTQLTWVSASFGWLATVVPIIIAAPMYFSGELSFGGLMMAVGAFNQVNLALRWYVNNFGVIADWRATLSRVSSLRHALLSMDETARGDGAISQRLLEDDRRFALCGFSVHAQPERGAAGRGVRLGEGECVITQGERVMMNGDPGVDRHLFFMALAGMWPWGEGEIEFPAGRRMIFMPQEHYLPATTLRRVLAYPAGLPGTDDATLIAALETVGLGRLSRRLDEVQRWDRLLDKDGQAALQIANALLRRPDWLIMDDVLEGLEPETQELLAAVLAQLDTTTLVYIGRSEVFLQRFSPRLLHLAPLHVSDSEAVHEEDAPASA